jgi:hypothetical protein
MAFHPRKVLSHLSLDSARSYLERFAPELAAVADWQGTDNEVRQRLEKLLLANSAARADLIASLQRVFHMGSSAGDRAMVAACGSDALLRQDLSTRPNPHERALWLLGHDPELFERAEEICQSDYRYGGRSWSGFIGPRGTWPDLAGEPLELFKARIETAFRQFDGSGARIVVEPFERGPASIGRYGEGRVFQLVAYLEGLPATSTEFGDGGIVRRSVRPAFEVALVYAPETGVIDVVARAGRPLREAVAKAFVEELFPQGADIEPVRLREVTLAGLARPGSFPVDPEDGIEGVRLTALRFAPNGVAGRVTLEAGGKDGPTLHELSRSWFGTSDPLARGPSITRARLAIRFPSGNGRRRTRTLQVELTEPHGCNLRDRSDEERLVGEKYLKRWGLVRDV